MRVGIVREKPPDCLTEARAGRCERREKRRRARERRATARRLGVTVREVKALEIVPEDVPALVAEQPDGLVAAQERRRTAAERQADDRLCAELAEAVVRSVHEVWFQELGHAETDAEAGGIDTRWPPEVDAAEAEARRLVEELTAEHVRARINRGQESARAAGISRASQLPRRAFGDHRG